MPLGDLPRPSCLRLRVGGGRRRGPSSVSRTFPHHVSRCGPPVPLVRQPLSAPSGYHSRSCILCSLAHPESLLVPQDYATRTTQVIQHQAAGRFLSDRPWLGCARETLAETRRHSEVLS